MERASEDPRVFDPSSDDRAHRVARLLRNAALAAAAAVLTYAVWRSYQNPDLILDLAVTLGLC
jgi:hypothetical protein